MGFFTFWKYFCDNFLMRAQNKMAIFYQAKPNNARQENKDKPIAVWIFFNMLNRRSCTWLLQMSASEQCIF